MSDPAVDMWAEAVYVRRRAHRKRLPPFTPCSRRHRSCSPAHAALVGEFRDARDARNALRESGPFMQLEDDDFALVWPPVLFRDWLVGHASRQREDSACAA